MVADQDKKLSLEPKMEPNLVVHSWWVRDQRQQNCFERVDYQLAALLIKCWQWRSTSSSGGWWGWGSWGGVGVQVARRGVRWSWNRLWRAGRTGSLFSWGEDFDAGGAVLPLLLVTSEKKSCLETFVGGGEGSGGQRRREKLEMVISEKLDLFWDGGAEWLNFMEVDLAHLLHEARQVINERRSKFLTWRTWNFSTCPQIPIILTSSFSLSKFQYLHTLWCVQYNTAVS